MSGYEAMSELFEGAGLGVPPVPDELQPEVREVRPWTFATFEIAANGLYDIDDAWRGALDRRGHDSFAVGHAGHGINSYALGYQVVAGPLVVVLQLAWGGVYMDAEKTTGAIHQAFRAVGSLLSLRPPKPVADGHLVVVSADFRELNAAGWLKHGEVTDVRAWAEDQAVIDPIGTARAQALEAGWTSDPTGEDPRDRFVWKPGDVTILHKGHPSGDP